MTAPAQPADEFLGQVHPLTVAGLPDGYEYGVTRYADVILQRAFPGRFENLREALDKFEPTLDELIAGGGARTAFVKRFDDSLAEIREHGQEVWGKQNITIQKALGLAGDVAPVSRVRGHEIDIFGVGSLDRPLPGIAVEMEWNNKDPFFDRDLINFQALHREGAIAVGVIVTRGPELQTLISSVIGAAGRSSKYGASTTHWDKLIPRINLGGGGECPLLLVGIQPARIEGIERAHEARAELDALEQMVRDWPERFESRKSAEAEAKIQKNEVLRRLNESPEQQTAAMPEGQE
ncbi:MAG: BglII/BstYI family type II restriction endonuclease [bacterium]|nr:BglII/BstYI family type II restriction endonuclease [bacterium]